MTDIPPEGPFKPDPAQTPPPLSAASPLDYASTPGYLGPPPSQDEKNLAILCHVLGIFTLFLGPLVVWLMKKESSAFVDDQGRESLNFWLCMTVVLVTFGIISVFCCIPAIVASVAWVMGIVFGIMGAIASSKGQAYRYPVNFRLVK